MDLSSENLTERTGTSELFKHGGTRGTRLRDSGSHSGVDEDVSCGI